MEVRTCQHCNKSFEFAEGRVFSNHVRWCDQNPNRFTKQNKERFAATRQESLDRRLGKFKTFVVNCYKCGKDFEVREREFQHPKKSKYHCSIQCRNSHVRTEESRKKVSETLKSKYESGELKPPPCRSTANVVWTCLNCQEMFSTRRANPIFCSHACRKQYDRKHLGDLALYKAECRFQFHIKDFPEEFDFDLIRKHGWYKAANHGNNLGGVSRDHMISVRWGFDHGILPSLLRHPANCKLLVHSDNSKKQKQCSLTVDELLDRIYAWDKKYGHRQY